MNKELTKKHKEEPKFKVGDWVNCTIDMGQGRTEVAVAQVLKSNKLRYFHNVPKGWCSKPSDANGNYNVKPWKPQPGEWCVIPSTRGRKDYCASIVKYDNERHNGFVNIEPFIGTLPTFIEEA